jgi:hypothetical protein
MAFLVIATKTFKEESIPTILKCSKKLKKEYSLTYSRPAFRGTTVRQKSKRLENGTPTSLMKMDTEIFKKHYQAKFRSVF